MAIIGGIPRFRAYPTVQSLQSHPGWSISPQPSCWFCFAGSSPRAAAMQVAIHRRKLPAASCEGMDIWVVQHGDWFTKKWQKKQQDFMAKLQKKVRISWLLLFWKATSISLALEIERRFKCSPFGARGVWWFQNRKACCQRWNHQLFVYIYCFSSIYYMILCFLLSMHKQALSIRNTDRLVVGAKKAICFPKYITWSKTILAFGCGCYTQAFSSGNRA